MRRTIRFLPTAVALFATVVAGAHADSSFMDWEAVASVYARSTLDYGGGIVVSDTCSATETYEAEFPLHEVLLCEAEAGYGYGGGGIEVTTTADDHVLETNAVGWGSTYVWHHTGSSSRGRGEYRQVYAFRVEGQTDLHLLGSALQDPYCDARVTLSHGTTTLVELFDPIDWDELPESFVESLLLGPGDYELVVYVRGVPGLSTGPGSAAGGGRVNLTATLSSTVGVESSRWGRIKAMYR